MVGQVIGIVILVSALPGDVSAASPAAVYSGLRIGMSKAAVGKNRKLKCLKPIKSAVVCTLPASRQKHEDKVVVWFLRGKLVSLTVGFQESWKTSHTKFVRPYIKRHGPPDSNESMPIPIGPYRGELMTGTTWHNVRGTLLGITSNKKDPYGMDHYNFQLMMFAVDKAKAVMNAQLEYEKRGITLP